MGFYDNNCRVLHETILKDIFDTASDINRIANSDDIEDRILLGKKSNYSSTSIARKTSNLICTFPVMMSSTISVDTATLISQALERKFAIMLELLFNSIQVYDSRDVEKILSNFHKNIKLKDKVTSVDDVIGFANDIDEFEERVTLYKNKLSPSELKAIKEDMRNLNFRLSTGFNENRIGDVVIDRDINGRSIVKEDYNDNHSRNHRDRNEKTNINIHDQSKYKKINELVPMTMCVNFWYKSDSESEAVKITGAIVGVKTRLIAIQSQDIIDHVSESIDDNNWLIKLVRATTREISFGKDFLLSIDKAKVDALSNSKRGSADPMWKVLERRAMNSRIHRLIGANNSYMAITSLVVSQEEVDYLKKEYNINLESASVVDVLFSKLNLICVCIVDESLETAKFQFDTGDGNWEIYNFNLLKRESDQMDYKKVVNLISRVSR